jgi:hypothetical protein
MKHARLIGAVTAIAAVTVLGLSSLLAQSREHAPPQKPESKESKGKETTLVGKIVDLQCYMTEEYATKDHAECTRRCIRAGVPVALETDKGLVIVGMGQRGPAHKVEKHALVMVELKGKLYEKHGLKYVDLTSLKPAKPQPEEEEEWELPEEEEEYDEP